MAESWKSKARAAGVLICLAGAMALWTKPALSAKRSSERHVETASASGSATSAPSNSQALVAHYGRLPLAFEPNVSHPESGVQYLAHGNGYTIFIGPNNATLA
jgi:hypothetical protein